MSGSRQQFPEYPDLKPYIEKLEREKAEQRSETLAEIWGVEPDDAREIAERLVRVGFFQRSGEKGDPSYWTPFLYRDAAGLVQGAARL